MKRFFVFLVIVMLFSGTTLSALGDPTIINSGLTSFIETLTQTAPNTAVNQNVYADAYIGKLFPSIPPHFAAGINTSFATLDATGLATAAKELGITIPASELVLPSLTVDARIGGLFLPFDLGVSFMKLPPFDFGDALKIDFLTWGADIRWALLQQNVILPNISIGIGYYQSSGSIAISNSVANASIAYKMKTIAFSAQVSKSFLILTPFIGGRFVMSEADNSYDWDTGFENINGKDSYIKEFGDLNQFNLYGGLSVNIFIVRLTPSVSYDVTNNIWTGTFSARVQL